MNIRYFLSCTVFFFFINNLILGQCVLSCADVQVSLDVNCEAEITTSIVSAGSDTTCVDSLFVEVYDLNGNLIPSSPFVNATHINQTLIGRLVNFNTGNFCQDSILVEDKLPPTITCPTDTAIYIFENPDTSLTGVASAVDACDIATVSFVDSTVIHPHLMSDTLEVVTRYWKAEDSSGNVDSCVQIIYKIKPPLSVVSFPLHLDDVQSPALLCGNEDTSVNNCGAPNINGFPVHNINGFNSTHVDSKVDLCDGSYALYREWKVIDLLAVQDVEHNQIIIVRDEEPPSLTCPADMTIATGTSNCASTVIVPNPVTSDLCASTDSITVVLQVSSGSIGGNTIYDMEAGVHQATCVATDACGNQSTCNFTITVKDSQPPVAVSNSHPNVTLVPNGATLVQATTFDDGSWDNCGNISLQARRMDQAPCDTAGMIFDTTVPFFCCDVNDTIQVELKVEDDAGNVSYAMSNVTVFDNTNPGILCAPDITIDCTADYLDLNLTGQPTVMDNCEGWQVDYSDIVDINTCGEGTVTRTWDVVDASDNTSNCTQIIYLENPHTFYINPSDPLDPDDDIIWPLDYTTYSCEGIFEPDSLPAGFAYPEIVVDTCQVIGISFQDTDISIVPDACRKILRTWIIIDFCQFDPLTFEGKWEYGQIIKVLNSDPPQFEMPCEDLVFCSEDVDCQGESIAFGISAVDDCTPSSDLIYQYEIDLFKDGTSDILNPGSEVDGTFPLGTHAVTFTVEDACGQVNACTFDFTIEDCLPPVPVCYLSLGIALNGGPITVTASTLIENATDNCSATSDLLYSFSSDINDVDSTFDCSHVGFNPLQIWATDELGNQSFCTAFLEIQDNGNQCPPMATAAVAGVIQNESGENIEEVTLHLSNSNLPPFITNQNGTFSFNLELGQDYEIDPEKNSNPLNGVTTFDLVLIAKHILGVELLDSPYKIIAADANTNGTVTTADIVTLRKLILHIDDDFPDGQSWRFVEKSHVFSSAYNPFADNFPEIVQVNNLQNNMEIDFVAIKKGDVNDSALPDDLDQSSTSTRSGHLVLEAENQSFGKHQSLDIPLFPTNFIDGYGFQFTLYFDPDVFSFEKIYSTVLTTWKASNYNLERIEDGEILISWHQASPLSLDPSQPILSLSLTTKEAGNLSEHLEIRSQPTLAEAYFEKNISGVNLNFSTETSSRFFVGKNNPNPFSEQSIIAFELPEADWIGLTIYNPNGQLVYEKRQAFTRGKHQIQISRKDLNGSGVYYFRLQSQFGSALRKMILLE